MNISYNGGLFGQEGLCYMGREIVKQLSRYHKVNLDYQVEVQGFWSKFYNNFKGTEDIYIMNGHVPHLLEIAKKHKKIISICIFETTLPDNWVYALNIPEVKEIWTISEFGRQMIEESGVKKPVRVLYLASDERFKKMNVNMFPKDKSFKFLNVSAPHCLGKKDRKGLDILIRAFKEEFGDNPNFTLILRINTIYADRYNKHQGIIFNLQEYIKILIPDGFKPGNIVLMTNYMITEQFNYLYNSVHCGVFPARSEGFGLCCHPNTELITLEGFKKIKDIIENDVVISHKGRLRRVTKKIVRRVLNEDMVCIKPYGTNHTITITKEHPVRAIKRPKFNPKKICLGKKLIETTPKWIKAGNLKKGDCVIMPKIKENLLPICQFDLYDYDDKLLCNKEEVWYKMGFSKLYKKSPKKYPRYIKLDNELAYILGWYVAEGSGGQGKIEFSMHKKEEGYAKEIMQIIQEKFKVNGKISIINNRLRLICSGKILEYFFNKLCGKGAKNKKIPSCLLFDGKNNLLKFMEGLYLGDGYYDKKRKFKQLSTSSRQLALGSIFALTKLGFRPSYHKSKRNDYSISYILKKGIVHSNKIWDTPKYQILLIKEIKTEKYSGEVYNLEVFEDNSYTTTAFCIHNCQLEMAAIGKPVITTEYSGHSEFSDKRLQCNILGLWPLDYNVYPYNDLLFSEPDVKHLRKLMRQVYENYKNEVKLAEEHAKTLSDFTWDKVGEKMNLFLKKI